MRADYKQLTQNIKNRINPDDISVRKAFTEELSTISYNDVLVYIRYAMKGVEPEYTQRSKEAGERVKTHLEREISDIVFRYQGSVMTDTHIKGHSDIDLLTITNKFYTWDSNTIKSIVADKQKQNYYLPTQVNKLIKETQISPYSGNSLDDLKQLRLDCESTLSDKYIICNTQKPKSIKIKNLDLNREVDVVIANWYDDVNSVINDKGVYRGIQVYDKDEHKKGKVDFPFLSIERINTRSSETNGRLKKMIRFLKNVKVNSKQDISLNSFDFNAICFDIATSKYQNAHFVELVGVLYSQLKSLATNFNHSYNLMSVDGREPIFRNNPEKLENLQKILIEVETVYLDSKLNALHS